jgi:hypothetical protein
MYTLRNNECSLSIEYNPVYYVLYVIVYYIITKHYTPANTCKSLIDANRFLPLSVLSYK